MCAVNFVKNSAVLFTFIKNYDKIFSDKIKTNNSGSYRMTELEINERRERIRRYLLIGATVLYFVMLVWVIIFKCNNVKSLHIESNREKSIIERLMMKAIPFQYTLDRIMKGGELEILATIFNVLCFAPMTILFRYFNLKKKTSWLIAAGISLGIEIFQLLSCWGGFDISDWMLNVFGAYLGIVLFDKLVPRFSQKLQYSIIAAYALIAIPVDVFAIINTALNFPE